MQNIILYILVGIIAGTLSGLVGIGGGIIIVPLLVILFGLTEHQAQGTSLAILSIPVCIVAAWSYYKSGYVNLPIAAFVALGFVVGGLLGPKIALPLPDETLRKLFAIVLMAIAIYMFFLSK